MGPTRIADLVLLGLDESDARTYLALLTEGATTDDVVAKLLDASVPAIRASFAALNEAGLVSLAEDGTIATPMRPGPGLDKGDRWEPDELGAVVRDLLGRAAPPVPVIGTPARPGP